MVGVETLLYDIILRQERQKRFRQLTKEVCECTYVSGSWLPCSLVKWFSK